MEPIHRMVAGGEAARRLSQPEETDVRTGHLPVDYPGRTLAVGLVAAPARPDTDSVSQAELPATWSTTCKG
jgi:hypothetical protein